MPGVTPPSPMALPRPNARVLEFTPQEEEVRKVGELTVGADYV